MKKREGDLGIVELNSVLSLHLFCVLDNACVHNVKKVGLSTVSAGHILVHSANGAAERSLTIFSVHVLNAMDVIVSNQESVSLCVVSLLLLDLFHS